MATEIAKQNIKNKGLTEGKYQSQKELELEKDIKELDNTK
jgi:hypothetical protein